MAHPVFWIAGLLAAGWSFRQAGGFLEEASQTTKLAVGAGGLYVSYKALQSAGVLK